jgi:hypothetical protein
MQLGLRSLVAGAVLFVVAIMIEKEPFCSSQPRGAILVFCFFVLFTTSIEAIGLASSQVVDQIHRVNTSMEYQSALRRFLNEVGQEVSRESRRIKHEALAVND